MSSPHPGSLPPLARALGGVALLVAGASCSSRTELAPVLAEQTAFDFLEHFPEARIDARNSGGAASCGTLSVLGKRVESREGGSRPALVLPPPASLCYDVAVPDAPTTLRFAVGIGQEESRAAVAVRFELRIDGGLAYSSRIERAEGKSVDWQEVEISLERQRGRVARIEFATSRDAGEEEGLVPAGFAIPRIVRRSQYPRLPAASGRLNVVIALVDTMRADHLSCYGYARPTTPTLDSLAADALVYDNAVSQSSWTWPATASVLTSLYPHAHGVISSQRSYLSECVETLPERLQREGYTTLAISANSLICRSQNFDQGFETFWEEFHGGADALADRFLAWLEPHGDEAFFAYLHFMDPHHPYEPPDGCGRAVAPEMFGEEGLETVHRIRDAQSFDRKHRRKDELLDVLGTNREHVVALYDAELRSFDDQFARIVDTLRAKGILDRTLLIVTSDHGEELWDHGQLGHIKTLHRELTRVPLLVRCPGVKAAGRVPDLVETIDLFPTVCTALGLKPTGGIDGQLLPGLPHLGSSPRAREFAFSTTEFGPGSARPEEHTRLESVVTREFKLIRQRPGAGGKKGLLKLFDVAADPLETRDLAAERPDVAARLERRLVEWIETNEARGPDNRRPWLLGQTRSQLEALGYVEPPRPAPDGDRPAPYLQEPDGPR